jgi:hypothetical protein
MFFHNHANLPFNEPEHGNFDEEWIAFAMPKARNRDVHRLSCPNELESALNFRGVQYDTEHIFISNIDFAYFLCSRPKTPSSV